MRWMQAGLAVAVAFFGVSRGALTDFVGQLPPCGVSKIFGMLHCGDFFLKNIDLLLGGVVDLHYQRDTSVSVPFRRQRHLHM